MQQSMLFVTKSFSAAEWSALQKRATRENLIANRLTYLAETEVNWCPTGGTVLK
jgi:leucyl-tRNA synthetase